MPQFKRPLADIMSLPLPRAESVLVKKPGFQEISGSLEPATPRWRILSRWPGGWLAFTAVATFLMAIALCWAVFAFVQWMVD